MPSHSTASVRNLLRRFRRNRRGSAAVEFALIAPVFFGLLFAIIETAIIFFAGQVLETMTQQAARQILTGQAQNAGYVGGSITFPTNIVCPLIPAALFACGNLYVDVQSYPYPGFSSVIINSQIDGSGHFINNMKFCPGNAGDIVVVRLFYQWPLFVTGLGYNIANLAGSQRLLSAAAAFRNEPFNAPPSTC